jgi:hypothetical protein
MHIRELATYQGILVQRISRILTYISSLTQKYMVRAALYLPPDKAGMGFGTTAQLSKRKHTRAVTLKIGFYRLLKY